jgi:hypothetical protein
MKNDLNILSALRTFDPIQPCKFQVRWRLGEGRGRQTVSNTTVIMADSRYDAIKKMKDISPAIECLGLEPIE